MAEPGIASQKEKLTQKLASSYRTVQGTDSTTALWEYRFNTLLYPALYDYVCTCALSEGEAEFFRLGFAGVEQNINGKELSGLYEKIRSLAREPLSFEDFLSAAETECRKTAHLAERRRFWFFKTGGMKIGLRHLRKISRTPDAPSFSVRQDTVIQNDGTETSVFDLEEAEPLTSADHPAELPLFLKEAQIEDFTKIVNASDDLYVDRTFGKSEEARRKADEDPVSPKKYMAVLLTSIFLGLYEVYKVIPFETFVFILRPKHFYTDWVVQEYHDTGQIRSQKDIAQQFGLTEQYLSGRRNDFFSRLKTRLSEAVRKDRGFFTGSLFTGFFSRNCAAPGQGVNTYGGNYEQY